MEYATVVFDCDGVILNSNTVKSRAFYDVALRYGTGIAQEFLDYHMRYGGISRYKKFDYLLNTIAPKHGVDVSNTDVQGLLDAFARQVSEELLHCDIAAGLETLKQFMPDAKWCVVSGGDQKELRHVFETRNISHLFDGGIFGSPDDKYRIVKREMTKHNIVTPAVFLGDSLLDHEVAATFDLDFVFLSAWSEFHGWEEYCCKHNITAAQMIADLPKLFQFQ